MHQPKSSGKLSEQKQDKFRVLGGGGSLQCHYVLGFWEIKESQTIQRSAMEHEPFAPISEMAAEASPFHWKMITPSKAPPRLSGGGTEVEQPGRGVYSEGGQKG